MQIRLLAFATAADVIGRDGAQLMQLPDDISSVGDLKRHLEQRYPELGAMWHRLAVAIDGEVATDEQPLHEDAEVALLPPVSGGALETAAPGQVLERVSPPPLLSEQPLGPTALAALQAAVETPRFGAVLLFLGNVRNHHEGRAVSAIHYDAYRPMAQQRLQRIIDELQPRHEAKLAISHRLGEVAAGSASVVIAVAAAHREACYDASRSALERLKAEVPIWKKELFADGEELWREVEPLT